MPGSCLQPEQAAPTRDDKKRRKPHKFTLEFFNARRAAKFCSLLAGLLCQHTAGKTQSLPSELPKKPTKIQAASLAKQHQHPEPNRLWEFGVKPPTAGAIAARRGGTRSPSMRETKRRASTPHAAAHPSPSSKDGTGCCRVFGVQGNCTGKASGLSEPV